MELHTWDEALIEEPTDILRFRVPGGWIYECTDHNVMRWAVFVPDPVLDSQAQPNTKP